MQSIDKLRLYNLMQSLGHIGADAHRIALDHGFNYRDISQQFALFHSEVAEGFEAFRAGPNESLKIRGYSAMEEELADVMLRILGFAHAHNLRLPEAMFAKNEYNRHRPFKHGNKAF